MTLQETKHFLWRVCQISDTRNAIQTDTQLQPIIGIFISLLRSNITVTLKLSHIFRQFESDIWHFFFGR